MPKCCEVIFEKQKVAPVEFSSLYPVLKRDTDEAGREIFVVVEMRDRQKEIDSFRDSCDMDLIVKRLMAGDTDIINQAQGYFVDNTKFPQNPQETFEIARAAEAAFYRLKPEDRAKYADIVDFVIKSAAAVPDPDLPASASAEDKKEEVKEDAES